MKILDRIQRNTFTLLCCLYFIRKLKMPIANWNGDDIIKSIRSFVNSLRSLHISNETFLNSILKMSSAWMNYNARFRHILTALFCGIRWDDKILFLMLLLLLLYRFENAFFWIFDKSALDVKFLVRILLAESPICRIPYYTFWLAQSHKMKCVSSFLYRNQCEMCSSMCLYELFEWDCWFAAVYLSNGHSVQANILHIFLFFSFAT